MKIGNKIFDFDNEYYCMGILNITPDSFSDGGKFFELEMARKQVKKMIKEGAHIIDVGGESTRPGHEEVKEEEEINRVVPVIKMIKSEFDIPVSIDTSKAVVAKEAIMAGADMVNDVWGLKRDENMADVVAKYDVPVCIMHNKDNKDYDNIVDDIILDLNESIDIAKKSGIDRGKIIIDVGIGFAKTAEQNLEVLANLEKFNIGYPQLLGTSRKSVIGNTLGLEVTQRVEGTIATTVLGMKKGARIFRVHDVKENMRAINFTKAVLSYE